MSTDFFSYEEYAHRQTAKLLAMFAVSVVVIILAIYLLLAAMTAGSAANRVHEGPGPGLWNPILFAWVVLGTSLVITVGSLLKIGELSSGGRTVALMVGGRALNPQTRDLAERRLLNVVEEMALAAGIPVPPVYVLDRESSINAFAAGYRPADAVVTVSRGCLEYLTRDELQGVIGHEFSHILNGDMRLNLRLIGIVAGILVLATIGYYIMRSATFFSSGDSRKQGGAAAAVMLGLALLIFGYLGVLLGNLIKSAISRQREFLADASSVQFTRNPAGIAGALKKIGGLEAGSRIRDPHASEISHMFFGDAFAGGLLNLFATHPPLVDRIRRWEPDFDGRFPEVQPVAAGAESVEQSSAAAERAAMPATAAVAALNAGNVAARVGRPQTEHLQQARQMMDDMPPLLLNSAREPFAARGVVFVLLLSREDEATRAQQWELLRSQLEPPLCRATEQLAAAAESLPPTARLPLVDLAIPALKHLSPPQYAEFRQVVEALMAAEGKIGLFEYCLRTVLFGYLDVHFGLKKAPAARYRTIAEVAGPAALVLSALAYVGQQRPEDVRRAFEAGVRCLHASLTLLPPGQCTLRTFDPALAELAQSAPALKRDLIAAVTACIAADGQVTAAESDLLRAIAAALACPLPPVIVQ